MQFASTLQKASGITIGAAIALRNFGQIQNDGKFSPASFFAKLVWTSIEPTLNWRLATGEEGNKDRLQQQRSTSLPAARSLKN